jgi:hypothetical protein
VKDDLADRAVFSTLALLNSNHLMPDSTMQNESAASVSSDPLRAIADAMDAAVQAAKAGGDRALAAATDAAPAASQFVSQAVYKTCYSISFGAVLPVVLLARFVPRNNALVDGLIDGTHAAIDFADQIKSRSVSS